MRRFNHAGLTFDVTGTPPAGGTGNGQVAVLLHGFPEDRHSWDHVIPALSAAGYRVLAPDQRGYSVKARPAGRRAYALPHLVNDVLALADAAGVRRFHLVGHDWGALVAWYLADQHPDRAISLAALSVPHPAAARRAMKRSNQAVRSWYIAAFQVPGLPEYALSRRGGDVMRTHLMRSGLGEATARRYATRAADRAALRGPINWYRAIPFALRTPIGPIEVPTLFVWGDGDRYVSPTAAAMCGRYVAGPYRFETLAGVSHWLPQEASTDVSAHLISHFASSQDA